MSWLYASFNFHTENAMHSTLSFVPGPRPNPTRTFTLILNPSRTYVLLPSFSELALACTKDQYPCSPCGSTEYITYTKRKMRANLGHVTMQALLQQMHTAEALAISSQCTN